LRGAKSRHSKVFLMVYFLSSYVIIFFYVANVSQRYYCQQCFAVSLTTSLLTPGRRAANMSPQPRDRGVGFGISATWSKFDFLLGMRRLFR
jgi:hypothetical protein